MTYWHLQFKGITKECELMSDWIRKEEKLITFGVFQRHELEECRLIRSRTLDVMLTIMKGVFFSLLPRLVERVIKIVLLFEFLLAAPCLSFS